MTTSLPENIATQMSNNILFRSLSTKQLNDLSEQARMVQLEANQPLFSQGDALNEIFMLISGNIKLYLISRSGNEKVVDLIHPGQTFAEAVLFSGYPRYPVYASAITGSTVIAINAKYYRSILASSPELCMNMMAVMSKRIHWMLNEIDRLTLHSATYRLIDYLLSLTLENEHGETNLILKVPKQDIASRISVKPETLSRILKNLSSEGLIQIIDSHVKILDSDKLRKIIDLEAG